MSQSTSTTRSNTAPFLTVLGGASMFLTILYLSSLWQLSKSSGAMANKFSALAREQYLGFLIRQNLIMIIAYVLLAIAAAVLAQPLLTLANRWIKKPRALYTLIGGFAVTACIHSYFLLRLMKTRPYFVNEAEFNSWYYKAFDLIPHAIQPSAVWLIFTALPIAAAAAALSWHIHRRGRRGWIAFATITLLTASCFGIANISSKATQQPKKSSDSPNVIIIGSDSLRGDRLGCAGYRPQRTDGLAAAGVSPRIDALAADSVHFKSCYTAIASTLESNVQLMSSQYPHSTGIRQMYPDRETVEATQKVIVPLPSLLHKKGYDTSAIGDWCAGFYEIIPLGMDHISVSSFDNFKIYMSQAVVMSHFVVPLYFDNSLGYRIFPQLQAFAQFVTPKVVTDRVEKRLDEAAANQQPFFWHVFYSCNHLPYRTPEPYNSMFSSPSYQGRNRNGVDFDIDSFIGGTDLESKWKALPEKEIEQIRCLYDGCTREFDDCVGRILDALKRNGLDQNTIVIVTADHGDDHYEPGVTLGHGLTFNGPLQANHIPLIIHVPGVTPKSISETVRSIDIIPTIAELTGVAPSPTWQGQSFAKWLHGTETPIYRPFYGETGFPFVQFTVPGVERPHLPPMDECTYIDQDYNYQFVVKPEFQKRIVEAKQRCLKTRDWKLVCTPTKAGKRHFELFNLPKDPFAEKEISELRPEVLAPMQLALERWMDEHIETPIADIFPNGEP